jgi:predicted enzyme related to lactoylglutathione lyase
MPGPPMWLYYISVDDVTSAVAKVKELGGQVVNGPTEVPGGDLIAQCLDPQGALFALHSTAPST